MKNLSFAEKLYLAAVFGDVSQAARERLLSLAEVPKSGVLIGGALAAKFENGRLALRVKPSLVE